MPVCVLFFPAKAQSVYRVNMKHFIINFTYMVHSELCTCYCVKNPNFWDVQSLFTICLNEISLSLSRFYTLYSRGVLLQEQGDVTQSVWRKPVVGALSSVFWGGAMFFLHAWRIKSTLTVTAVNITLGEVFLMKTGKHCLHTSRGILQQNVIVHTFFVYIYMHNWTFVWLVLHERYISREHVHRGKAWAW